MNFELRRVAILEVGAFGVLMDDGVPFAVTLERTYTDADGEKQSVKIPTGTHRCTLTTFVKGGYKTFEVNVAGHSRILLHKGNVETDSDGCVLVGESFQGFGLVPGIGASGAGFAEFIARTKFVPAFDLVVS